MADPLAIALWGPLLAFFLVRVQPVGGLHWLLSCVGQLVCRLEFDCYMLAVET